MPPFREFLNLANTLFSHAQSESLCAARRCLSRHAARVDRSLVFALQQDRNTYLDLIRDNRESAGVRVLAYCLMTNHVHWVVIPERSDSLAVLFRRVHGKYAQCWNARQRRTGHLWQKRFFSCAVSDQRVPLVVRYVERNPIRANMVREADEYLWSSAKVHCTGREAEPEPLLDWEHWESWGQARGWRELVAGSEEVGVVQDLRACTYASRPWGDAAFQERMERSFGRRWHAPGRPRSKPRQQGLFETEAHLSASVG